MFHNIKSASGNKSSPRNHGLSFTSSNTKALPSPRFNPTSIWDLQATSSSATKGQLLCFTLLNLQVSFHSGAKKHSSSDMQSLLTSHVRRWSLRKVIGTLQHSPLAEVSKFGLPRAQIWMHTRHISGISTSKAFKTSSPTPREKTNSSSLWTPKTTQKALWTQSFCSSLADHKIWLCSGNSLCRLLSLNLWTSKGCLC